MKTLLAILGTQDPYSVALIEGTQTPGPVLTALQARPYDRLVLLHGGAEYGLASLASEAARVRYPQLTVDLLEVPSLSSSRLAEVIAALKPVAARVREGATDLAVSLEGVSPLVGAAVALLAAGGELPGRLLGHRGEAEGEVLGTFAGAAESVATLAVAEEAEPLLDTVFAEVGCVGVHPRFRRAMQLAASLARSSGPVLLSGEVGTGKEAFARAIHRLSPRRRGPFVTVAAATLLDSIAETTLFGSFRGAAGRVSGKVEAANGGTLFITDIARLSDRAQTRLMRLLDEGVLDVGTGLKGVSLDLRLIATTSVDLEQEVLRGSFRVGLYDRLKVAEIELPPLRERRQDIAPSALRILEKINQTVKEPRSLSKDALTHLQRLNLPGNLRDLRTLLERAVLASSNPVIGPGDLASEADAEQTVVGEAPLPILFQGFSMEDYLGNLRRRIIYKAIDQAGGNQSEASRLLGISPQAVNKFLKVEKEQAQGGQVPVSATGEGQDA